MCPDGSRRHRVRRERRERRPRVRRDDRRGALGSPTTSYVETAPTVVDGTVYTADADGVVFALGTDGERRWTFETNTNLHSSAVAVHEGTLFVGTAGTMPAVASGDTDGSKAGTALALDTATGARQWTYTGPTDWFTGPAVGGGRVYFGNHDGSVVALDPATGAELWTWDGGGEHAGVLAPPAYADGTVYVGVHVDGRLVALDAASGTLRWETDLRASNVKSSPAVDDDRVYVAATGSEATDYDAPGESTPTPTPRETPDDGAAGMPTVDVSGSVFALSRNGGDIEWRYETDHDFRSSPAVVDDRVYIGGGDRFLALSRADGAEQWHVSVDDFVESSPAVAGGRAYIGSADGHLYCIGE
ncbi:PQQ-binding-like beta-propeller repeat protein [Halobaculum litoreum]|uniref:PQQ-binding-like beta-propeller repeat protein n=1 Tax=Halobaculum litoreum TaxID=3031998 RepID=A0ABD5XZT9_9EURY